MFVINNIPNKRRIHTYDQTDKTRAYICQGVKATRLEIT